MIRQSQNTGFHMIKSFRWLFSICFTAVLAGPAQADDLLRVYQQAVNSDPVFAEAQSTWKSAKLNLPIARANY